MRPEAQHAPARRLEERGGLEVALAVAGDLLGPVGAVALRHGEVLRAAVPVAPVDEHGEAASHEGDVDRAARRARHLPAQPIPGQAPPAQRPPQLQLGTGVLRPVAEHRASGRLAGRPGVRVLGRRLVEPRHDLHSTSHVLYSCS